MGMQFNPMYQPTSTKTINVDGDLDLNPYDVLAVDGKFDTVEADEFVGGVGNFSSLTSAGNIVLNGDTDVKGLLHAEENLQVDGSLLLEGSINNVNIADDGTITTSKSVTATGGFKGNVTGSISGGTVAGSTGTFSGAVTGASGTFNILTLPLSANGTITLFSISNSIDIISTGTFTSTHFYIRNTGSVRYTGSYTATIKCTGSGGSRAVNVYKNGSIVSTFSLNSGGSQTVTIYPGEDCYFYMPAGGVWFEGNVSCTAKV